jgi:hypothetical protein
MHAWRISRQATRHLANSLQDAANKILETLHARLEARMPCLFRLLFGVANGPVLRVIPKTRASSAHHSAKPIPLAQTRPALQPCLSPAGNQLVLPPLQASSGGSRERSGNRQQPIQFQHASHAGPWAPGRTPTLWRAPNADRVTARTFPTRIQHSMGWGFGQSQTLQCFGTLLWRPRKKISCVGCQVNAV